MFLDYVAHWVLQGYAEFCTCTSVSRLRLNEAPPAALIDPLMYLLLRLGREDGSPLGADPADAIVLNFGLWGKRGTQAMPKYHTTIDPNLNAVDVDDAMAILREQSDASGRLDKAAFVVGLEAALGDNQTPRSRAALAALFDVVRSRTAIHAATRVPPDCVRARA